MKGRKPSSAGQRHRIDTDYSTVLAGDQKVLKKWVKRVSQSAGRNNNGTLTVRHRGGGSRRLVKQLDFARSTAIQGVVTSVEYCSGRSAYVSKVVYRNGDKRYVLAADGVTVGTVVSNGPKSEIRVGSHLPIRNIPVGTSIHNIALNPGGKGILVRAAGTGATLVAKVGEYGTVRLPSGEVRMVHIDCSATVGQVGNSEHKNRKLGKAGATRWRGRRPQVRGSVMNACDHPHGGGEGKAPIGRTGPRTPTGKPALGFKTRNRKKPSTRFIVERN